MSGLELEKKCEFVLFLDFDLEQQSPDSLSICPKISKMVQKMSLILSLLMRQKKIAKQKQNSPKQSPSDTDDRHVNMNRGNSESG